MKRKISIELYEEYEKVNFYTLRFQGEETEFDKFLDTYPEESVFNDDVEIIIRWIEKIGAKGAFERYFRPEGKFNDDLFAIPLDVCNLRVYVLRISERIVILGNGGNKTTDTYNKDEILNSEATLLQKIGNLIKKSISNEKVHLYNGRIYGKTDFTIEIE